MKINCNQKIYSKQVILKAAFCFTDRAYIFLSMNDGDIIVDIVAKLGVPEVAEKEFLNELLAQALRETVIESTKDIRKLIISRALSSTIIDPVSRDKPNLEALEDSGDDIHSVLSPWKADD